MSNKALAQFNFACLAVSPAIVLSAPGIPGNTTGHQTYSKYFLGATSEACARNMDSSFCDLSSAYLTIVKKRHPDFDLSVSRHGLNPFTKSCADVAPPVGSSEQIETSTGFEGLDLAAFFNVMDSAEVISSRRLTAILASTGWDIIEE